MLGFELIEDSKLSEAKRWVLVAPRGSVDADCRLLLAKAEGPEQIAATGNQCGGRVSFFLKTDNFDQDYQLMCSKGVSFLEQPRSESFGKVVVFQDPFGNKWDLLETE